MKKMTIITDTKGEVLGTAAGHADDHSKLSADGWSAKLVAGPGQKLYEVEVPEDVAALKDLEQLHQQVKSYLPNS